MGKERPIDPERARRDGIKRTLDRAHLEDPAVAAEQDRVQADSWAAARRDPLVEAIAEAGQDAAADVLRGLMLICLPPKAYGDSRRWRSGYHRLIAFAWRLAPELLDGCRTNNDVARLLGLCPSAFHKHIEHVDKVLQRPSQMRDKSVKNGSFLQPRGGRGSD